MRKSSTIATVTRIPTQTSEGFGYVFISTSKHGLIGVLPIDHLTRYGLPLHISIIEIELPSIPVFQLPKTDLN